MYEYFFLLLFLLYIYSWVDFFPNNKITPRVDFNKKKSLCYSRIFVYNDHALIENVRPIGQGFSQFFNKFHKFLIN